MRKYGIFRRNRKTGKIQGYLIKPNYRFHDEYFDVFNKEEMEYRLKVFISYSEDKNKYEYFVVNINSKKRPIDYSKEFFGRYGRTKVFSQRG